METIEVCSLDLSQRLVRGKARNSACLKVAVRRLQTLRYLQLVSRDIRTSFDTSTSQDVWNVLVFCDFQVFFVSMSVSCRCR